MKGFCWNPQVVASCHPTVEIEGREREVVGCLHDVESHSGEEQPRDWFVYKRDDGGRGLAVFDVDGEIREHIVLFPKQLDVMQCALR